ncbi:ABC transporter ATP-binding protein [Motiliproteus coralliicola]|uniref:ABC transporter ATP-binding protein n=2 Tax=Motiliproteus coralliicola TaxID=2283196 RepID=A0A369WCT0_9GAMM|nr:ABC transporter ATP-binding protein [Motiliproteus coralliicola]
MKQPPALLEIRNLAVEFQMHGTPITAVKDLSLTLRAGTTLALVGESGSGKTVTSQAILGILPRSARISAGEILFTPPGEETVDIAQLHPDQPAMRALRGDQISIIFQEPMVSLSSMHTIGNQIMEAMLLHRDCSKQEAREATIEMLRLVGFPEPQKAIKRYPFELSGGLRQRAMIAMALICRPALLIADEPTTALDVTVQAQILKLIKSLQQEFNMAVLLITHDLGVVANMADDVVVMYHGEVMERGPAKALFEAPRHPYLKALFSAVPHFDMRAGERLTPIREIEHDIDHFRRLRTPWTEEQMTAGPHLQVSQLSKSFSAHSGSWFGGGEVHHHLAVQDVSLEIGCGECFGLVGESGCGKTTLSKMLMRAVQPDSGKLLYNDRGRMIDLLKLEGEELRAFRPKMRIVFQDPFSSLNPRMTVLNILVEPMQIHQVGDAASQLQRARELMALVGLDPRYLNRYPHSFSGGQRQRISIARALALDPELLIFDEPVSALDVSVQAQILNLLKDLQHELGLTYLFISHNLAVVDYIADRIGVMCRGQLVEVGRREQIFRNPQHPYTKALLAAVPYPDLSRPLDFELLESGRHNVPELWPDPYCAPSDGDLELIEIEPDHQVRRQPIEQLERSLMS